MDLRIPAPHLPLLLSRDYDIASDYVTAFRNAVPREYQHELTTLAAAAASYDLNGGYPATKALAVALLKAPPTGPTPPLAKSWLDYLSANSCRSLGVKRVPNGQRLLVRLECTSKLTALAIRHYLDEQGLILETGARATPETLAALPPTDSAWLKPAFSDGSINVLISTSSYSFRYDTMKVSGFVVGPDHPQPTPQFAAHSEYHGNTQRFLEWIRLAAPHCFFLAPRVEPRGDVSIQFCFTSEHACELYQLDGATSPPFGVTRPLKLKYFQQRKAHVQCCARCGAPGHSSRSCSLVLHPQHGDVPASALRGVCRSCYSPEHVDCFTATTSQHCKVCLEDGHTSFRCPQYKTTWVRVDPPSESRPRNPRPAIVLAQQRGLPPPSSWSSVVQRQPPRAAAPPGPAPPAAASLLHSLPFLPPSPGSPAPSTASLPASPASSAPPSPVPSEFTQLFSMLLISMKEMHEATQLAFHRQSQLLSNLLQQQQEERERAERYRQQADRDRHQSDLRFEQLLSLVRPTPGSYQPPLQPLAPLDPVSPMTAVFPAAPSSQPPGAVAPSGSTSPPLVAPSPPHGNSVSGSLQSYGSSVMGPVQMFTQSTSSSGAASQETPPLPPYRSGPPDPFSHPPSPTAASPPLN